MRVRVPEKSSSRKWEGLVKVENRESLALRLNSAIHFVRLQWEVEQAFIVIPINEHGCLQY